MKKIKSSLAFNLITIVILLATIFIVVYCQRNKACYDFLEEKINISNNLNNNLRLGSDRDSHGCIASAGYSWCETKNKCLRLWEEECNLVSEIIELDDLWSSYLNYDLGFKIDYPRYTFDGDTKIIENGDIVYISAGNIYDNEIKKREGEVDYDKVKGITYALLIKNAVNEEEIEEYIKNRYGEQCLLGEITLREDGLYSVRVESSDDYVDFDDEDICYMNFAYTILYDKEKSKIVSWDNGQAVNFYYQEDAYDNEVNESFRFID